MKFFARTISMSGVLACTIALTAIGSAEEGEVPVLPRVPDFRRTANEAFSGKVNLLEEAIDFTSDASSSHQNKVRNQARRTIKEMKYQEDWLARALYLRYKFPDRHEGFQVLLRTWVKTTWRQQPLLVRKASHRVPGPVGQFGVRYLHRFLKESVIVPWLMLEAMKGDVFSDEEREQLFTYILDRFVLDTNAMEDAPTSSMNVKQLGQLEMTPKMILSFMVDLKQCKENQAQAIALEYEKRLSAADQRELKDVTEALKNKGEGPPVITGPLVKRTKSPLMRNGKPVYIGGTAINSDFRDIDALPFCEE